MSSTDNQHFAISNACVLFVDDEEDLRHAVSQTLELAGIECECHARATTALKRVERNFCGIVLSDIRIPDMDGIQLMAEVQARDPELPVILVTGHGDIELAVEMMRKGAYDFLEKPYDPDRLIDCVQRAIDMRLLRLENRKLRAIAVDGDPLERHLQGRSESIVRCREQVRSLASTDADVLLIGHTGVGKEVIAKQLHALSARCDKPFVHINCAALPDALVECELFGHESGAFPGATSARAGRFAHADTGTVCLDEIDSLPLAAQGKLLDALHSRCITPLGSNTVVKLDFRVIALSKRDLERDTNPDQFRRDLLYRLNTVTLRVPNLSERVEDVPLLFAMLVTRAAALNKCAVPELSAALLAAVASHPWPGNVRELGNAAERYVLGLDLAIDGSHAQTGSLTGQLRNSTFSSSTAGEERMIGDVCLADRVAQFEKAHIAAAIVAHRGRLKEVYLALGLSRKTLYDKMQKYGLSREDYAEANMSSGSNVFPDR